MQELPHLIQELPSPSRPPKPKCCASPTFWVRKWRHAAKPARKSFCWLRPGKLHGGRPGHQGRGGSPFLRHCNWGVGSGQLQTNASTAAKLGLSQVRRWVLPGLHHDMFEFEDRYDTRFKCIYPVTNRKTLKLLPDNYRTLIYCHSITRYSFTR